MRRRGSPRSLTPAPLPVSLLGSDEGFITWAICYTFQALVTEAFVEMAEFWLIGRLRIGLIATRRWFAVLRMAIVAVVAPLASAAAAASEKPSAVIVTPSDSVDIRVVVVAEWS